jgi:hypothetical protein
MRRRPFENKQRERKREHTFSGAPFLFGTSYNVGTGARVVAACQTRPTV